MRAVILSNARTPFGRLGGALSSLSATTLGGDALRHAVARRHRSGRRRARVDGQRRASQNRDGGARRASHNAGLAKTTTAETLNKLCASGLVAVAHAAALIRAGRHAVVVAGGMESMSNAPYLLPRARFGYRFGNAAFEDALMTDALMDPWFDQIVSSQASSVAAEFSVSREAQDHFAFESHRRAHAAAQDGRFKMEIAPVAVAKRASGKIVTHSIPVQARERVPVHSGGAGGGMWAHRAPAAMVPDPSRYSPYVTGDVPADIVDTDEAVRADISLEALARLKPIEAGGTITAGNAPGVNDGAAALVLASDDYARGAGLEVLAEVVAHEYVAWDTPYLALTPAMAAQKLLEREGLTTSDIAIWEINEAFAAVAYTSAQHRPRTVMINLQGGAARVTRSALPAPHRRSGFNTGGGPDAASAPVQGERVTVARIKTYDC